MRPRLQVRSPDFLKVPRHVRELRGVSWPAKAVACAIRYRQQAAESVSGDAVGSEALARELGIAENTVLAAIKKAVAAGLLKILNPDAPRGSRRVYDARPMDTPQSAARSAALCGARRPKVCGQSASRSAAAKCRTACGGSAARSAAVLHKCRREERQEGGEEGKPRPLERATDTANNGGNGDDRLVAFWETARAEKASDGERAKFLEAVGEARRAGATEALIAHGIERHCDGAPWAGPNAARDTAREVLADWHGEIGREPKRETVDAILADVDFSATYLRGAATGRDGRPAGIEPAGRARGERVLTWAKKQGETLAEARGWPDMQARRETA